MRAFRVAPLCRLPTARFVGRANRNSNTIHRCSATHLGGVPRVYISQRHASSGSNGAAGSTSGQQQQQQSSDASSASNNPPQPMKAIEEGSHNGGHGHTTSTGFFSVLREEFGKLFHYVAYDLRKTAATSAESAKAYAERMTDANLSEEEKEKRRLKTEAYNKIMAKNAQMAKEADEEKTKNMTWKEKMAYRLQQAKQAASPQQGIAALVQHCAAAHQAEVAVEQGIDVEDIQIVLEQVKKQDGIGFETKVVGYIDAPKASEEQVHAYVQRLKQKCPAAGMMESQMDWKKKGSDTNLNTAHFDSSGGRDEDSVGVGGSGKKSSYYGSDASLDAEIEELLKNRDSTGGAGANAFPSSFRNRNNKADHFHDHDSQRDKSGFINPFAKLKILKEEEKPSTPSSSSSSSSAPATSAATQPPPDSTSPSKPANDDRPPSS